MVKERIEQLRTLMKERGIDAYMIPTSDFHESEYVGPYFKCREYMTGFTGSAGTVVITMTEACLWTDGRYFVQAAKELNDSGVILQKMGQEGVPTIEEYLEETLPEGGTLGFDGRVINAQTGEGLEELLADKNIKIVYSEDLVDHIWTERPKLESKPVWILEETYSGKSAAAKVEDLRAQMEKKKATRHILTTLDDIVWLLNIRGDDVACNPVVLSYLVVTKTNLYLFISKEAVDARVRAYLEDIGVDIMNYNDIYQFARDAVKNESVLLEKSKTNYTIFKDVSLDNKIINMMNPTAVAKAVKNPVEVENMRKAHIKDGVAMTKFIYWIKKNIGKMPMDEITVSDYLETLRHDQEGNLGLSFPTISAYRENAAMCHYSATESSKKTLEPSGLYLVDSGGQYYEGTTDVTRTVALGPISDVEREHFTLVAMSMLRLANVKFLHGCRGLSLDYVAREPFWSRGLNFDHGTGHGVGYLLNVHERPNGIRWRMVAERQDNCELEEGMITSDEPGLYIEGSHGIRTENLIVCKKLEKTMYGQFMGFEFLTFVPIDLDALDVSLMEKRDVELLNAYHRDVFEKISPYLEAEEAEWLKEYTREVQV